MSDGENSLAEHSDALSFPISDSDDEHVVRVESHDIATLADPLVASDSLSIQDAYNSICRAPPNPNAHDLYSRLPETRVRLSMLKQAFEGKKVSTAMARLQQRSTLVFDDDYVVDLNDPGYSMSSSRHFLDFILVVGASIGLDMFIPKVLVDHTFSIELNLHLQIKQFRGKHGTLGFDPTGAMWCIGATSSVDLWIGMAPHEYFLDGDDFVPVKDRGDSRLSGRHYRIMLTFVVWLLTRLRARGYELAHPYDTDLTGNTPIASDVIREKTISLNLDELRFFSDLVRLHWDGFVEDAPDDWKNDSWIMNRAPVGIVSLYGQNRPLGTTGDSAQLEGSRWRDSRDYTKAKWLSYAVATHYEYRKVEEWLPMDEEEILERGDIYDSHLPEERSQVQLEDLPLTDDNNHEINIYDSNGYRIPRRYALHDGHQPPCGLLADLTKVRDLFKTPGDAFDDDDERSVIDLEEEEDPLTINVYPQAYTRQLGHFQANNVPSGFHPLIRSLNDTLRADIHDRQPVIRGVACQAYNHIQHCLTERAGGLDVVHGQITAALAGVTAKGPKAIRAHDKVMQAIRGGLPHERVARKLGRKNVLSRAWRVEPVFVINVQGLEARFRSGGSIYREIILPLLCRWSHPSVLKPIKHCTKAFIPEVFPNIYLWTTYGIVSALEKVWKSQLPSIQRKIQISPYVIEVVSALERALAMAYTGDARVIVKDLMVPFGLKPSLLDYRVFQ